MEDEGETPSTCERTAESAINLTLLDPPRFGWTASGGVADLLHPHEVCRLMLQY